MGEIKKETVLYNREKDGVEVTATQFVEEQVVEEATEDKEAVVKDVKVYQITANHEGRQIKNEAGKSYRQAIQRARKMFKEVHAEYVPKEEPQEKVEQEA